MSAFRVSIKLDNAAKYKCIFADSGMIGIHTIGTHILYFPLIRDEPGFLFRLIPACLPANKGWGIQYRDQTYSLSSSDHVTRQVNLSFPLGMIHFQSFYCQKELFQSSEKSPLIAYFTFPDN